ncbi:MAG: glycosyl transferase, group 1 [uncultured bacterium]|nr:MAG: glycosyl transferase, group 1 [uncultured bacterium]
MLIGIDGSRAFMKNRTGIEEYSYQVIKNLRNSFQKEKVFLYTRKNQKIDFDLPEKWEIRVIKWPRFWTQIGLSLEILSHPVDVLFVPAHTVPIIHPEKTVVTIHGLEYEFCPKAYSFWERIYMRVSIKNSCRWASKIIAVSKNTKKDLVNLYGINSGKIAIIYNGFSSHRFCSRLILGTSVISHQEIEMSNKDDDRSLMTDDKHLLFIGRIEERKNISNIVKAFEILKEEYKIPHKLILAGKPGYGYEKIKDQILYSRSAHDILELGFVSEEEKWELLKKAEVFVFPTQYEGFGIPILEAQSVGTSVVASRNSSIPEVVGGSALLVDPENSQEVAEAINKIISNETLKDDIIAKGLDNIKRFSWEKCASYIAKLLID